MTHTKDKALKLALEALEENHHLIEEHERPEYLAHYDRVISAVSKARSAPVQERNFCERCGKRLGSGIHTCTPPAELVQEPVAWNTGVPPLYPEMKEGETISVAYTT